jgi:cardiolipin synthase C
MMLLNPMFIHKKIKGISMQFRNAMFSLVMAMLLNGCSSTPVDYPDLAESYAQPPKIDGGFSQVISSLQKTYAPDQSGFMLLDSNEHGLQWRLALIDQARHTLDLQYYLWYPEDSARLIATRLLAAADRGVRVRIILDDLLIIDNDKGVAAFDHHPNIEVRLFNPWDDRESLFGRGMEGLERFEKLNYRMHNKLLIADNQAVILGGRNIGDHYFGLSDDYNFHDLDVLGIGPIAPQTSEIFDHFWNSEWVHTPYAMDEQPSVEEINEALVNLAKKVQNSDRLELFPIAPQDQTEKFATIPKKLVPGLSKVIYDKVDDDDDITQEMRAPLQKLFAAAKQEILIINAYIIPNNVDMLKRIMNKGIKVRILTNSLESNDVAAVNSHYEEWRKPLIEAGADLYEMRADGAIKNIVVDTFPVDAEFMGLHSKAMVVDRKLVFIGSMNFDPRSVDINSEMGVVIYSPQLGEQLAQLIERDMLPENSWYVQLDEDGDVYWESGKGIETSQPARNFGQRMENVFFKMFPKEMY